MEVLRHLRPHRHLNRLTLASLVSLTRLVRLVRLARFARGAALGALAVLTLVAPAEAQRRGRGTPAAPAGPQWPVKVREHVDLWFHGFALLQDDTSAVPLFDRGYAERITVAKNARGLYTPFDSAREDLAARLAARGDPTGVQFIALYFGTWEEMAQAFDYFLKAEGDPQRSNNRDVQTIIVLLGEYFPRADDREFARRLLAALSGERERFHRKWWLSERRSRELALAAADSLWQRRWRPSLQRFLNHTQQQSGDLILSLTLGGEGRALPAGKTANQFAVSWPRTADEADVLLFAFAHEAIGSTAQVAVNDHLTPAQQRAGLGANYVGAGLVRGGAMLVERIEAGMGARYARWYLRQMGRDAPADDASALAALASAFPMPGEMLETMERQIALAFTGI